MSACGEYHKSKKKISFNSQWKMFVPMKLVVVIIYTSGFEKNWITTSQTIRILWVEDSNQYIF